MHPQFHAPPWDAPLDVSAELDAVRQGATIKGMFILPMILEAQQRGIRFESARDRYLPFADYPLVEHGRLLVESARAFYPKLTTRQGLRKLGHAGLRAFAQSTIGKVVWAAVDGVDAAMDAAAKTYAIAIPAGRLTIVERSPGLARVRLTGGVHYFLDSNHVGNFEGLLRACHVQGTVAVRLEPPAAGELLLTWSGPSVPPTRP
jgi:uncharacterized protein (TIGR02265 family)